MIARALSSANSRRTWTWAGLLSVGWAATLVEFVTLEWVPDCGGVAYGAPLPYVQTSLASSLEFAWYAAPWLADVALHALVLLIPAMLVARRVLGLSRWARALSLAALLAPWLSLVVLALLLAIGAFYPELAATEPVRVHEWRSVRPYLGAPEWRSHIEPACD